MFDENNFVALSVVTCEFLFLKYKNAHHSHSCCKHSLILLSLDMKYCNNTKIALMALQNTLLMSELVVLVFVIIYQISHIV